MRTTEKELLFAWVVNEQGRLQNELIELRNRIRFRMIDVTDNLEMILTQQRYEDFRDFALTLFRLLNLDLQWDRNEVDDE